MNAPLPANEAERLAALRQLDILDSAPDQSLDDLTQMAAHICEAPIALISLVDENRQWFKSKVGLSASETSRDISFCAHAILNPEELLIVPDATADSRFADNSLVTAAPQIRFYAGAPLTTSDGHALGTLCVIDRKPRGLSEEHKRALRLLRNHVVSQLELRRALADFDSLEVNYQLVKSALALHTQAQKLAHFGCFEWNLAEDKLTWSDELYRIYGHKPGEFEPTLDRFLAQVHEDDRGRVQEAVQNALQKGDPWEMEERIIRPDGSVRVLVTGGSVQVNERGQPSGLIGVCHDITAHKRVEQALRTSELRYRSIVEDQTEFIVRWLPDGVRTFVNESYCRYFGTTRDEALGTSFFPLISEEDHKTVQKRIDLLSPQNPVSTGEHQVLLPDGTIGWNMWTDRAIYDQNGALIEFQSVGRDITERKRAEQALRKSLSLSTALFEHAAIPIWEEDFSEVKKHLDRLREQGVDDFEKYFHERPKEVQHISSLVHVRDVNQKSLDFYHARSKKELNKFLPDWFTKESSEVFRDEIVALAGGAKRFEGEIPVRTPRGEIKYLYMSLSILPDHKEPWDRVFVSFIDITERKQAEEALKNALTEVEQLKNRLEVENIYLQDEIKVEHNFGAIIGSSKALNQVLGQVEQVAATDSNVLILGETGTGKELIARAVHELSNRAARPLVKVNSAVLPASLIESELFGHEKGAFTGALTQKTGRFELADGGTIFLDEIGDLPLDLQVKLLRVLQESEFERLGSSKTLKIDMRVIAATNRDIEKLVQEGTFRQDLFFRLNVFPIVVPPLRDRTEDIPLLTKHLVERFSTKLGKKVDLVPARAMKALQSYHWPGNVRELENVIERAMVISQGNKLELGDWFLKSGSGLPEKSDQTLEEVEKQHILNVLDSNMWRVSGPGGAAEKLGLKPTTLESRMKKLGIFRPS